ncbi:uncharacterized protein LOC141728545 [Zonotrichia albicollis]|uniref:uncharacterized protein LOC141728545 n=1 Tax=Zonotrichia albicollis TaxID=44394 RepID=UPI003D811C29
MHPYGGHPPEPHSYGRPGAPAMAPGQRRPAGRSEEGRSPAGPTASIQGRSGGALARLAGNTHERDRRRDRRARVTAAPANGRSLRCPRPAAARGRRCRCRARLPGRRGGGRGCFHDVRGSARGQVGSGAEGTRGREPRGQEPRAKPQLSPRARPKRLGRGRRGADPAATRGSLGSDGSRSRRVPRERSPRRRGEVRGRGFAGGSPHPQQPAGITSRARRALPAPHLAIRLGKGSSVGEPPLPAFPRYSFPEPAS